MAKHEDTINESDGVSLIDRREAIRRVAAFLGGTTLVGGSGLLAACERERAAAPASGPIGEFTSADIAYLDEIAETILPETKTPGAKAAKTGAFMALMVTDTYKPEDQKVFRDGMRKLEEESRKANNTSFMSATPQQRLSLIERLDREAKAHMDARAAAREAAAKAKAAKTQPKPDTSEAEAKKAEQFLPDQRKEAAPGADVGAATAITAETPTHYFRMMKELAMLGYFTSEVGCTQALRYVESPGRFDPCVPYRPGERAWAPHA